MRPATNLNNIKGKDLSGERVREWCASQQGLIDIYSPFKLSQEIAAATKANYKMLDAENR